MADRVHHLPTETTPLAFSKPSPRDSEKPVPPPGTYVIQIPKDQVYRVPPAENASRYQSYTIRKPRRSCCCCWFLGLLAAIVLLSAAAAGVFYLVVLPESPNYSVESIAFKGFNLTTTSSPPSAISPEIHVTVRAQNPNKKIGIYYERESSVKVFYSDIKMCDGVLPAVKECNGVSNGVNGVRCQADERSAEGLSECAEERDGAVKVEPESAR